MDEELVIKPNETLALLYWIAAVLNIIAAIFFLIAPHIWQIMSLLEVMANKSIFAEAWGIITPSTITLVLYIVAIAFFAITILDIICAYGAGKGKDWATPFGIAAGISGLINIPVGTVLSIIILASIFWDVVERNAQ
jgi:hypothetical protein